MPYNGYAVGDKLLSVDIALPNGAAAVTSSSIDLGHGTNGANVADYEIKVSAPVLGVTPLPNTETMVYDIVTSASSDLSTPTVAVPAIITQTGAGGVGDAAATALGRLPSDCQRYIGLRVTNSGAGDASGSDGTIALKF